MSAWALVTGASSGIGLELARLLAADHVNLLLVARSRPALEDLASSLQKRHGVQTRVLAQDLSIPGAAAELFEAAQPCPVSILINNAGLGSCGPFAAADLKEQTDLMQVNLRALVELTHFFLPPMLARRQGRILNVASTAAFQPGPMVNLYYASKAFVFSFSYALAAELDGSGVTVTTLCPGTTRTAFFQRARLRLPGGWPRMEPARVARAGYRGLLRGRRVVIPGLGNQILSFIARRAPVRLGSALVKRLHRPYSGSV